MHTTTTPRKRRPRSKLVIQRTVGAAPAAALLRKYALAALVPGARVTLRVVGSAEGRLLNRSFRQGKAATNVLAFSYDRRHGDVVLCHPVIAKEARAQGKSLAAHYAHLVVHGVLHLRGHNHLRKKDAARMEKTEIRLLRRLGFADPYAWGEAVK